MQLTGRACAWAIKDGGGAAGGSDGQGLTRVPTPTPGEAEKEGRVPRMGRLYFTAIQNHLLKTGGTGKTGGA